MDDGIQIARCLAELEQAKYSSGTRMARAVAAIAVGPRLDSDVGLSTDQAWCIRCFCSRLPQSNLRHVTRTLAIGI
jgi:hypothetical protein